MQRTIVLALVLSAASTAFAQHGTNELAADQPSGLTKECTLRVDKVIFHEKLGSMYVELRNTGYKRIGGTILSRLRDGGNTEMGTAQFLLDARQSKLVKAAENKIGVSDTTRSSVEFTVKDCRVAVGSPATPGSTSGPHNF